MERRNDKKNILIAGLLLVVLMMSVGFALLSSNLKITATGTTAGDWQVTFASGSLQKVNQTDGVTDVTAELDSNNLEVTINANFEKPGDSLTYKVAVENAGSIDAYLKTVDVTGDEDNTDVITLSYEVKNKEESTTYARGAIAGTTTNEVVDPIADATLVKKSGETVDNNYIYVTLEYPETAEQVASGASATYTLDFYYEQAKATNE